MALIALPTLAELPSTGGAAGGEPEQTYRWDKTGIVQPSSAPLADERSSPRQTIVRIAQAALVIGLTGLGLGITFTSLLSDMKRRRRAIYRPRGPSSTAGVD